MQPCYNLMTSTCCFQSRVDTALKTTKPPVLNHWGRWITSLPLVNGKRKDVVCLSALSQTLAYVNANRRNVEWKHIVCVHYSYVSFGFHVFFFFFKEISSSFEPINERHQTNGFLKFSQAQHCIYYNNVPFPSYLHSQKGEVRKILRYIFLSQHNRAAGNEEQFLICFTRVAWVLL